MTRFQRLAATAFVLMLSHPLAVDAAQKPREGAPTVLPATAAMELQGKFINREDLDISVVWIARLKVGEKRVSVTSLNSTLLAPIDMSSPGQPSISAVRFTSTHDGLEFFSRNPKDGSGLRLVLPLNGKTKQISFPILHDGELAPQDISLENLIHKP